MSNHHINMACGMTDRNLNGIMWQSWGRGLKEADTVWLILGCLAMPYGPTRVDPFVEQIGRRRKPRNHGPD